MAGIALGQSIRSAARKPLAPPRQPNETNMKPDVFKELERLLTISANCSFDCGEAVEVSADEYDVLAKKAREAHNAVVEFVNTICSDSAK